MGIGFSKDYDNECGSTFLLKFKPANNIIGTVQFLSVKRNLLKILLYIVQKGLNSCFLGMNDV